MIYIELIPETVSVNSALEAQKHNGMVHSSTPAQSPVQDTDDHFDSFKSSLSNFGSQHQTSQNNNSSMKSSKSDFFAKRTMGNVNFLLNSNSGVIGNAEGGEAEEMIDIFDDTH